LRQHGDVVGDLRVADDVHAMSCPRQDNVDSVACA
jgi:hypothetical protein